MNEIIIESKSVSRDRNGNPEGKIVYHQKGDLLEVYRNAPELGSKTEHLPKFPQQGILQRYEVALVLAKVDVSTTGSGDVCTVTLTYKWPEGGGDEISINDSASDSFSLSTEDGTNPIILHPRYAGVSESERVVAAALVANPKLYELVYVGKIDGELVILNAIPSGQNKANFEQMTLREAGRKMVKSKLGNELCAKILKGIKEYRSPKFKWTSTTYENSISVSKVGKISAPKGNPPSIDGNWLLTEVSASMTKSEGKWKVTKTWKASDDGSSWDAELYGNKKS